MNPGAGRGVNVLQLLHALESATGRTVPNTIGARPPRDIAEYSVDPAAAARLLGWRASRSIGPACADRWRWLQQNPNGYRE